MRKRVAEARIQSQLWYKYVRKHPYLFMNMYYFDWEADFLIFAKSGFLWELEIKCGRQDFRDDFKKVEKHTKLKEGRDCPNKFFFIAKDGVIPEDEIPDYAGYMVIDDYGNIVVNKRAPLLHNRIYSPLQVFDHMYHRCYRKMREAEWKELAAKKPQRKTTRRRKKR